MLNDNGDTLNAGYADHLDSYAAYTRTEVSVSDTDVRFVIRSLDTF